MSFKSPDPILEMIMGNDNRFMEMVDDKYMQASYDVVAGTYPKNYNEIALVVNKYNEMLKTNLKGHPLLFSLQQ